MWRYEGIKVSEDSYIDSPLTFIDSPLKSACEGLMYNCITVTECYRIVFQRCCCCSLTCTQELARKKEVRRVQSAMQERKKVQELERGWPSRIVMPKK